MSKSLASYPEKIRMAVAQRRTSTKTNGLGYWGAVAFLNRNGIRTKEQTIADSIQETMHNAAITQSNTFSREEKHAKAPRKFNARPVSSLRAGDQSKLASLRGRR